MKDLAENPLATNPLLPIPIGARVKIIALVGNGRFVRVQGQKQAFGVERFDLPRLPTGYAKKIASGKLRPETALRLTALAKLTAEHRKAVEQYRRTADAVASVKAATPRVRKPSPQAGKPIVAKSQFRIELELAGLQAVQRRRIPITDEQRILSARSFRRALPRPASLPAMCS